MSVLLSNRQLPMLEALYAVPFMTVDEAGYYDQRSFASMLAREYCAYQPNRGFYLTAKGKEARQIFLSTDIGRKNPRAPLTSRFDLAANRLAPRKKRKGAPKDNVRAFVVASRGVA